MAMALPVAFGLAGLGAALANKPKMPDPPPVMPTLQERPNNVVADALASRRGSGANKRTGPSGAEPMGGVKSKLGQ